MNQAGKGRCSRQAEEAKMRLEELRKMTSELIEGSSYPIAKQWTATDIEGDFFRRVDKGLRSGGVKRVGLRCAGMCYGWKGNGMSIILHRTKRPDLAVAPLDRLVLTRGGESQEMTLPLPGLSWSEKLYVEHLENVQQKIGAFVASSMNRDGNMHYGYGESEDSDISYDDVLFEDALDESKKVQVWIKAVRDDYVLMFQPGRGKEYAWTGKKKSSPTSSWTTKVEGAKVFSSREDAQKHLPQAMDAAKRWLGWASESEDFDADFELSEDDDFAESFDEFQQEQEHGRVGALRALRDGVLGEGLGAFGGELRAVMEALGSSFKYNNRKSSREYASFLYTEGGSEKQALREAKDAFSDHGLKSGIPQLETEKVGGKVFVGVYLPGLFEDVELDENRVDRVSMQSAFPTHHVKMWLDDNTPRTKVAPESLLVGLKKAKQVWSKYFRKMHQVSGQDRRYSAAYEKAELADVALDRVLKYMKTKDWHELNRRMKDAELALYNVKEDVELDEGVGSMKVIAAMMKDFKYIPADSNKHYAAFVYRRGSSQKKAIDAAHNALVGIGIKSDSLGYSAKSGGALEAESAGRQAIVTVSLERLEMHEDVELDEAAVALPKSIYDRYPNGMKPFKWSTPARDYAYPWRVVDHDGTESFVKSLSRGGEFDDVYVSGMGISRTLAKGHEKIFVGLQGNRDKASHQERLVKLASAMKKSGAKHKVSRSGKNISGITLIDDIARGHLSKKYKGEDSNDVRSMRDELLGGADLEEGRVSKEDLKKPWTINGSQWLVAKGIPQPWVGEISHVQYARMGKQSQAAYDKKRRKEWEAAAKGKEEWNRAVQDAYKAEKFDLDDSGVSREAVQAVRSGKRQAVEAEKAERMKQAERDNELRDASELKVGDEVYSVRARRYVKVAKVSKKSVQVDDGRGGTIKEKPSWLQWLSHNDLKKKVLGEDVE
jgi:hypothetical protein